MAFFDTTDDVDVWDNTQDVTLTSTRRGASLAEVVPGALGRQPSTKERAPSGGVYQGADRTWLLPTKHVKTGRPKPSDVIEPNDGSGEVYTVLSADWACERAFHRLYCVDLSIHHDLRDKVTIERPAISYDAAGVAVLTYPPDGGSAPYANLAARVQLIEQARAEERLIEGFRGTHTIIVAKQIDLQPHDRVKWLDGRVTRYFDIVGLTNPERIDELPVLGCELKP